MQRRALSNLKLREVTPHCRNEEIKALAPSQNLDIETNRAS